MFTEVGSLLKRMTLMTSSEFRAKQSLEAIREAVGQMQSVDLNVVGDDGYSGAADRDAPAAIPVLGRTMSRKMSDRLYMARTRAQVVEMRDQHYKVMVGEPLRFGRVFGSSFLPLILDVTMSVKLKTRFRFFVKLETGPTLPPTTNWLLARHRQRLDAGACRCSPLRWMRITRYSQYSVEEFASENLTLPPVDLLACATCYF